MIMRHFPWIGSLVLIGAIDWPISFDTALGHSQTRLGPHFPDDVMRREQFSRLAKAFITRC
jgi:hypothetical protein